MTFRGPPLRVHAHLPRSNALRSVLPVLLVLLGHLQLLVLTCPACSPLAICRRQPGNCAGYSPTRHSQTRYSRGDLVPQIPRPWLWATSLHVDLGPSLRVASLAHRLPSSSSKNLLHSLHFAAGVFFEPLPLGRLGWRTFTSREIWV